MKNRSKKKAFTIVELVIVIAVIGVLTAILVPTFVNLTNKANKAADESLVTNLNKALAIEENEPGNEKNVTMHNAVLDLENEGYKLSQLVTKSGQDLVWSMDENRFHLDNGSYSGANFWKIYHKAADIDGKFSAYAGHDWPEADASVTLEKTGFDVGFNEGIAKVVFDHSAGTSAVDVTIRTNSVSAEASDANLKITAFTDATSSDTIRHYGLAGYVHVIQGGAHSFHAHSTIGFAKVEKGRFVADSGAVVKQAYVTGSEALLTKEGNGVYENTPYAATEAIKDGHTGVPLQYDSGKTEEDIRKEGIEGVTPVPETPVHVLTEEDIAAQKEGMKVLVDGTTYKSAITENVDNFFAMGSHTMKLIGNLSLPGLGLFGAKCEIDLNGYSLLLTSGINAVTGSELTIRDASGESGVWGLGVDPLGYGLIGVDCVLNIYGGTFDATGVDDNVIGSMGGGSAVNIYGGKFIASEGNSCLAQLGTINIQGGTFDATAADSAVFNFKQSVKSVDVSKATIVEGSTLYRPE